MQYKTMSISTTLFLVAMKRLLTRKWVHNVINIQQDVNWITIYT